MCGYSLRGLESESCPECGSKIVLQVRPAEPRMGWWTAGLIGLASGFGFFLVVTGVLLWAMIVDGELDDLLKIWPLLTGMVVSSTMVASWLRFSGRLRRAQRSSRVCLAVGCWLASTFLITSMLWILIAWVIF